VDVKYLPGKRYEYTPVDIHSRFVYARIHAQLNAFCAESFLIELSERLAFEVHTAQVDGGGFKAEFAQSLEALKLGSRRNDPHSPWQNTAVERFHHTVAEECWLGLEDELENLTTKKHDQTLKSISRTVTANARTQASATARRLNCLPHAHSPCILNSQGSVQLTPSLSTRTPGSLQSEQRRRPLALRARQAAGVEHGERADSGLPGDGYSLAAPTGDSPRVRRRRCKTHRCCSRRPAPR
jgi:hypothetical protein